MTNALTDKEIKTDTPRWKTMARTTMQLSLSSLRKKAVQKYSTVSLDL